jgi:hypothetical protein
MQDCRLKEKKDTPVNLIDPTTKQTVKHYRLKKWCIVELAQVEIVMRNIPYCHWLTTEIQVMLYIQPKIGGN